MIAEDTGNKPEVPTALKQWSTYLEELHACIAHRFSRPEVRDRVRRYLSGLLGEVGRKNSWQIAEAIGEARPRGYNTSSITLTGMQMPFAMNSESTS